MRIILPAEIELQTKAMARRQASPCSEWLKRNAEEPKNAQVTRKMARFTHTSLPHKTLPKDSSTITIAVPKWPN